MYRIEQFELNGPRAGSFRLAAGSSLRVSSGRLWVTVEGGSEDIWLLPGDLWQCPKALRLWISAEPEAEFQVLHLAEKARGPLMSGARRMSVAPGC